MPRIVYPELSYKINGGCFGIAKKLGRFCREKQYSDEFESWLKQNNLNYQREFEIKNLNR